MPIDTKFTFTHIHAASPDAKIPPPVPPDYRGLLAGFVGNQHQGDGRKQWKGHGFNLIWRPNFNGQSGSKDFFLELNLTKEILDFTDFTGTTGIANRGSLQPDIFLGGISYLQQVFDAFDGTGQHVEPGVWINVPASTNPNEPTSVTRMGSIPHGSTINLEGVAFTAPAPVFLPASIVPFRVGSPDDGTSGLVNFPEETLATPSTSRTPLSRLAGLTQPHLTNPNLFLHDAIAGQHILGTTVLIVASSPSLLPPTAPPVPPHVSIGGGLANIGFLTGVPPTNPNANVPAVTATFWIEKVREADGTEFLQLQYTQRVILSFKGLNWPHISVATLR
jgi:hypothetical protein